MVNHLEGNLCEELQRPFVFVQLRAWELRLPHGGCGSSHGVEGQCWALLSVAVTGPEGMALRCVGVIRERFFTRECGHGPEWPELSVWTVLWDGVWIRVVLCGAKGWPLSLWVPFDFGFSVCLRSSCRLLFSSPVKPSLLVLKSVM